MQFGVSAVAVWKYYLFSLVSLVNLDISFNQVPPIDITVDSNASGLSNCNKCSVEFLKLSVQERALWTKYVYDDKNTDVPAVRQSFSTMSNAAAFNQPDIETLEVEEKNLLKYYLQDLKISPEEVIERLDLLYQTLLKSKGWQLYQSQVMDSERFTELTNALRDPIKEAINNVEVADGVKNFTDVNVNKNRTTHEEL